MTTDLAILATEALADARSATPGPWAIDGDTDHRGEYRVDGITSPDGFVVICDSGVYPPDEPTARFIAAARTREPLLAAGVLDLTRQLADANRELERWRHGVTIEGDFVCPDSLALSEARAELRAVGKVTP